MLYDKRPRLNSVLRLVSFLISLDLCHGPLCLIQVVLLLLFKDRIIALIACMCKSKHIQQNKGKYCPISIELSAQEACPVCRESGVCKLFAEISYRLFCTLHRLLIDWYATSQLTAQEPYLLIGMNNQAFCHQNINGRTPDSMVLITVIP